VVARFSDLFITCESILTKGPASSFGRLSYGKFNPARTQFVRRSEGRRDKILRSLSIIGRGKVAQLG
jgi:hypothetical protein